MTALLENKFIRFLVMIALWCAGFLPGLLTLKSDMVYGSWHLLFLGWGIALVIYMILWTLTDDYSSSNFRWLLGAFVLGTGVLGTACGAIAVYNAYQGERGFALMWVCQMVTFSSLMLISFLIAPKLTDVGHTIYQIVATAICYIVLLFNPAGDFAPVLIIIFIIAGYLGFLGLTNR